jgi:malate dehydrogenase (oxaloacetate-decarboxylating)(NADP+)
MPKKKARSAHAPRLAQPRLPTGFALLRDPLLNKGTAFTRAERAALGLRGLLPPCVATQEKQMRRILEHLSGLPNDLEKFVALNALHDRNEALFFRIIAQHPDMIMPLIYTPTVGLACQRFGRIYQRPRGLFISAEDRGRIASVLRNWPYRDVAIIVVTDGARILGLGDLGANGMGIPVGKLSLYTGCAGVPPERCLPVLLDVGTDNDALRADPFYIGLKRRRLRGRAYDAMIDEFMTAVQQVFPGALIQFEDFANQNAFRLLQRYRDRFCTFNDDIQGTAAVALAGIYSALRITGGALREQRILCLGAGEAARGICDLIVAAMADDGLIAPEARGRCWLFDSHGLVVAGRPGLAEHKRPYAHARAPVADFVAAVETIRPTAIIGVAAVGGTFTRPVLEAMARINARPIVFALSNPTSNAECTAEQAYAWTGGRAVFACGSPFDPVSLEGRSFVPRQGNNSYIFPGLGLGVLASRARRVTDEMFLAAARALARQVSPADLAQGSIYPPLARIREVSARIAAAVAEVAFASGLAAQARPRRLLPYIRAQMYQPRYRSYV